mgnify:CR=1 FL=1
MPDLKLKPPGGRKHPQLADFPDPAARTLIFRASDIEARLFLCNLAKAEYGVENFEGCAKLIHAMLYLEDRLKYALFPPPGKYAIPLPEDHA